MHMRPLYRFVAVLGVVVIAGLPLRAGAAATTGRPPTFHPPSPAYLALGDSLAFGFQEAKFLNELATNSYSAASFDTGYDADFAAMIRPLAPPGQAFHETNFSCPGETTGSLIHGPCPFPLPLHDSYPAGASQLQAALAFLRANPHRVNPITLDIGG